MRAGWVQTGMSGQTGRRRVYGAIRTVYGEYSTPYCVETESQSMPPGSRSKTSEPEPGWQWQSQFALLQGRVEHPTQWRLAGGGWNGSSRSFRNSAQRGR